MARQDVDMSTVCQVVQAVQQAVAKFYGPQCQQTLLTSDTGQAVITSDGLTILDSLEPSHPVAVLVTSAVRNCLRHSQDGCKVFLLYLSAVLKGLELHINNGNFCHSGTNMAATRRTRNQQGAVTVAKCLQELNHHILPKLQEQLVLHSSKLYTSLTTTQSHIHILQCVFRTTLAAHYNPSFCDFFSGLAVKFLAGKESHSDVSIQKCLRFSLDHYGLLCIKVPNRPYAECSVLPTLLIRRDFAVKLDHILKKKSVKVLLLRIEDETDDERPVHFSVNSQLSVPDLILQRRQAAQDFVTRCAAACVDVVICSDTVSGYILDKCRQQHISVITNILKEDIDLMEHLTGKFSVDWHDAIRENQNLIEAQGVERLGLGGQVYIQVKIDTCLAVNHLVVCAPTVGMCDQAAMAIQKGLTSMLLCFSDQAAYHTPKLSPHINSSADSADQQSRQINSFREINLKMDNRPERVNSPTLPEPTLKATCDKSAMQDTSKPLLGYEHCRQHDSEATRSNDQCPKSLKVIQGGGGFELLLSELLLLYEKTSDSQNLVSRVLAESLVHVVKVLYENVAVFESPRGFQEARQVLQVKRSEGSLWGLSHRGEPCDVRARGVLEPLHIKLHIFTCVIALLEQLLKTDKIVSVKKLSSDGSSG